MVLLILLSVLGCRKSVVVDEDGDGVEAAFDCDDTDADIGPDMPEDCTEVDRNCDGSPYAGADGSVWYADGDGDGFGNVNVTRTACVAPDGFVAVADDCDDREPGVFPGAPELCDGVDQDCDDAIDESATDWVTLYEDVDGDGFGDDAVTLTACPDTPGYALVGGDCDDDDDTVAPDLPDICNGGVDDDCDATTDENVDFGTPWFVDGDLDGFGDDATAVWACEAPAPDLVALGGDCSDGDDTRYPGAIETCDLDDSVHPDADEACDGIDNDCDPATTDDDAPDAPLWAVDSDGDGFGDDSLALVPACVQPGDTVLPELATDCDDTNDNVNPDATEVCNGGRDDDCDPDTDEQDTRTWYADFDGDGWGDPDVTARACLAPADFVGNDGDCDDAASDLNPSDTPGCIQDHCGTIAQNETWRNTVGHTVSCDVKVEGTAKPTLTIQGGSTVRFATNTALLVANGGEGRIVVDGDLADVRFTSDNDPPVPGDWDGLTVGPNDQGSQITGLVVEYGGRNGVGGLRLNAGNFVLEGLTARDNANDGLHVDAGVVTVVDGLFTGNSGNGITIDGSAELARSDIDGGAGPSFQRNVVTANLGRPISLPGSVADEIEASNVLTGNTTEAIELRTGTLRFSGTWEDHDVPYFVKANALIEVQDGPQAVLTIADGVEIVFDRSAGLRIANNEAGKLIVDGHTEGVLMTASPDVIAQSDAWDGITFGPNDAGSEIRGLTIEYGGDNGNGNLYVRDSAPVIAGVISRFSDADGLAVTGSDAAPSVTDSSFTDNDENGVTIASSSSLAVGSRFTGNVLTGNGLAPLECSPGVLGQLDASSSFAGNALPIEVAGGTVLTDATWPKLDEVYQFMGSITVEGPQDPVLTIEDGVQMVFDTGARFNVGVGNDGSLVVDGSTEGVGMGSAANPPGPGDWFGLRLGSNNGGVASRLVGLTIAHAGGSDTGDGGALELVDPDGCGSQEPAIVLSDLVIHDSSKHAVHAASWVTFGLDDAVMTDNRGGCVYVAPTGSCQGPTVESFTGNVCTGSPEFGTWPLAEADHLDDTSTYPGPVVFRDATLTSDVRLRNLGVPYHFMKAVNVGETTGAVLTVAPGNTLAFDFGLGLVVGTNEPGGVIFESGTPVTTMTSLATTPGAGDWDGIKLGRDCSVVEMEDVDIRYAGDNGTAALWFDRCDAAGFVDRVSIESSSTCGLFYDDAESTMTIGAVTYASNGTDVCP
ncbi:MAG: putative metal-binding motif-containing protein [Myxococcota bacterium]